MNISLDRNNFSNIWKFAILKGNIGIAISTDDLIFYPLNKTNL